MSDSVRDGMRPAGSGDYIVVQGDTMSSIAERHGLFWETLWELPANAELKAAREDPEVLLPGDRVTLIPIRTKSAACETGRRHVFRRRGIPVRIRFALRDERGDPLSGERYTLTLGERRYEGRVGSDGIVEHWVMPTSGTGELTVFRGDGGAAPFARWPLRIGHLDPIESLSGLQARLNNLGFACGAVDSAMGPKTEAALRAFQTAAGLEPTGAVDDATIAALRARHDAE
ncbi:PGRP and LysM peptidoglycan-binding domain-containing protein [Sorangium sp. So ce1153]|uniref:PGRP and LysM peptidoglycan-binding domain-containing protein n=1 Tax=Sorangium sp. So ce1153 TaxID=3133333 RepID=UPI003F648B94